MDVGSVFAVPVVVIVSVAEDVVLVVLVVTVLAGADAVDAEVVVEVPAEGV